MKKRYKIKYGYIVNDGTKVIENSVEIYASSLSKVYEEIGYICSGILNYGRFIVKYIDYELVEE